DPIAEWSSPPLTTVRQDFAAMGRAAASALAAALGDKAAAQDDAPAPAHAATAVALVARGSISAPPAVFPETPGSAREHSTATDGDRQHSTTL
ncbi:MAG: substrate-binding domain-containing protein, partial [Kiritimatiellae bacterium]|nr:substrate-binding domain-containing protein [Kiritimatiellia bacterium]